MAGKSIRIYLPTGSVNGIRHAEIANWTGQALSCPRSEMKSLNDWDEVNSPGVYFLFGTGDDGQHQAVYIGEAENVRDRLQNHVSNKDFWNEVICFTNKDESLTKSHVKYLEAILIEQAKGINRYHLQNTVSPNKVTLPRAERDAMKEFSDNVRILLGALGHKVIEPYSSTTTNSSTKMQATKLRLLNKNAYGERVSDGFLVHRGSEMALTQSDAQRKNTIMLFESLIKDGVVIENKESYNFAQQHLFSSPSYAASLLNGYPTNGLDAWRNEKGQSLKEIEAS